MELGLSGADVPWDCDGEFLAHLVAEAEAAVAACDWEWRCALCYELRWWPGDAEGAPDCSSEHGAMVRLPQGVPRR